MGSKSKRANWRNGVQISHNSIPNEKRWTKLLQKTSKVLSCEFLRQVKRNLGLI